MTAKKTRVFKKRSNTKKYFTFHSYGTHYQFDPYEFITDDRLINEIGDYESMSKLDFYMNEVRMAKEPHVYILDNNGKEVQVS